MVPPQPFHTKVVIYQCLEWSVLDHTQPSLKCTNQLNRPYLSHATLCAATEEGASWKITLLLVIFAGLVSGMKILIYTSSSCCHKRLELDLWEYGGKTCLVWKTPSQHCLSSTTSLYMCVYCWVYWELAIANGGAENCPRRVGGKQDQLKSVSRLKMGKGKERRGKVLWFSVFQLWHSWESTSDSCTKPPSPVLSVHWTEKQWHSGGRAELIYRQLSKHDYLSILGKPVKTGWTIHQALINKRKKHLNIQPQPKLPAPYLL